MSSVPSLIPIMPELSVKLRIKINYHQLNEVIPNTHSNAFQLNSDHNQQLTKWCSINLLKSLFSLEWEIQFSDLEKSSLILPCMVWKTLLEWATLIIRISARKRNLSATFHSRRPKLSKSYFVAVAFQAKFSSSTYDKCATVFAIVLDL